MIHALELPDLRGGYIQLIDHVVHHGTQCAPRGLPIIELTDVTFTVEDLTDTLPLGIGRDINTGIAAVEALQLIGETSAPDIVVAVAPQFQNYREPEGHFHGAYGDRVGGQVLHVIDKIDADRDTRQAVLTLWDPKLDNLYGRRDYPCTVAMGFRIRDDKLDLSVLMRSNDVWLGVAYDVFQFTQLQWSIAHELEVEPGRYTHTAWSLHLYERDLPRVANLHEPRDAKAVLPRGLRGTELYAAPDLAAEILTAPEPLQTNLLLDESARWYLKRMLKVHQKMADPDG